MRAIGAFGLFQPRLGQRKRRSSALQVFRMQVFCHSVLRRNVSSQNHTSRPIEAVEATSGAEGAAQIVGRLAEFGTAKAAHVPKRSSHKKPRMKKSETLIQSYAAASMAALVASRSRSSSSGNRSRHRRRNGTSRLRSAESLLAGASTWRSAQALGRLSGTAAAHRGPSSRAR